MELSKRSEVPNQIVNLLLEGEKELSDLADRLKVSKQAILKHLRNLEDRELIKSSISENRRNRKIYSLKSTTMVLSVSEKGYAIHCKSSGFLNPNYPLLVQIPQDEFRLALVPYLEALTEMDNPPSIVLFGSVAREEGGWKSDIDVALVKERWEEDEKGSCKNIISSVAVEEGIEYSLIPKYLTYQDFKKVNRGVIEKAIVNEGILIYTRKENDPLWQILVRYKTI